jgi:hypothetical protein
MENSFPYYTRLQNPRILSKSLVLFHTLDQDDPEYNNFCMWVYSNNKGTLLNLLVPAVSEELRSYVIFVLDDNDERIYSFLHSRL